MEVQKSYCDTIFELSNPYLNKMIKKGVISLEDLSTIKKKLEEKRDKKKDIVIREFSEIYTELVKKRYQSQYNGSDQSFNEFIKKNTGKIKIVWGDCLDILKKIPSETVHLMVTSPPYYNARDYSQWNNLKQYLSDMKDIIKECYRVIDNHRAFVFNVGDITGNDNLHTKSSWGSRRIPLGAYFINIFEEVGFKFIDDFIWDKGQVQSERHKNGDNPSPLYQYPMNCYEHIMIFYKHRQDETLYPCPICGCLRVNGNAYSGVGIRSWECKNLKCVERSASNRGKRFSARSILMESLKTNNIEAEFIKKWRRDIVAIPPKIKINSKGENTLGHTAPFPYQIPEFAIKTLTGKGEIVVDPFAGSFTTAIQSIKLDRIGVGFEINKKLFKKSILENINKNNMNSEEIEFERR